MTYIHRRADGQFVELTVDEIASMQPVLDSVISQKLADISSWRDAQETGTVEYNGHVWQADIASRTRLEPVVTAYARSQSLPAGFYWTTLDNVDLPVTYFELEGLLRAIVTKGFAIHARQRQMKLGILEIDRQLKDGLIDSNTAIASASAYVIGW